MRMRHLSVLLVAMLALALGGCFTRGQAVPYQQYAPAAQATQPISPRRLIKLRRHWQPLFRRPAASSPPISADPMPARPPMLRRPVARRVATLFPVGLFAASFEQPYLLDAGDRLRITVFGQDGLTNSYAVDAAGNITMPLVGSIAARGRTPAQLSRALTERLKQGYIREPKVAIEVEAYRPFFIYGEVLTPGQYAYVANMTVEKAIAIAGGFGPRADRSKVTVSRTIGGQTTRTSVPLTYPLRPGDTLRIDERWF